MRELDPAFGNAHRLNGFAGAEWVLSMTTAVLFDLGKPSQRIFDHTRSQLCLVSSL